MSTDSYFWHDIIHYIAITLKVLHMQDRLKTWCFFEHKSLKRDNKRENDEIKKCEIARKN